MVSFKLSYSEAQFQNLVVLHCLGLPIMPIYVTYQSNVVYIINDILCLSLLVWACSVHLPWSVAPVILKANV